MRQETRNRRRQTGGCYPKLEWLATPTRSPNGRQVPFHPSAKCSHMRPSMNMSWAFQTRLAPCLDKVQGTKVGSICQNPVGSFLADRPDRKRRIRGGVLAPGRVQPLPGRALDLWHPIRRSGLSTLAKNTCSREP